MSNLPPFQQFLVDKGFTRTCIEPAGSKEVENYNSASLSAANPLQYEFRKDRHYCFWGLVEAGKPPVMHLGASKILVLFGPNDYKTNEDGYRILFSKWKEDRFDEIYDVLVSDNKFFEVDCRNQNDIKIEIKLHENT